MRVKNFGEEPPETLLSADVVADASLHALVGGFTGQVIYVSR